MPDNGRPDAAPEGAVERPHRHGACASRGRRAQGRGTPRGIKRTVQIVLFWLVFNNLILPQLGGFKSALDTRHELNPVLLVLGLGFQLAALASYSRSRGWRCRRASRPNLFRLVRIQLSTKSVTNLVPGGSAAGAASASGC